jgi:hypothetical protein
MIEKIWYYIVEYKPAWPYRIPIMLAVGGFVPVLVHHFLSMYYSYLRSMELTFILMIPIAAWLMNCHNNGWLDEDEDR